MQQTLLTRAQAWQALMTLSHVNGQRVLHRTITEMVGHLHCIITLEDGKTTVEVMLPHEQGILEREDTADE